jgi:hypothetical protein
VIVKVHKRTRAVFELVEDNPGATIRMVSEWLAVSHETIGRLMARMRERGMLFVSYGDGAEPGAETGSYQANPEVEFYAPKKKTRQRVLSSEQREAKNARLRERARAKYVQAVELGRCVKCFAGLLEEWNRQTCPECTEMHIRATVAYYATDRGTEIHRENSRRYYLRNREKIKARRAKKWMDRKLRGQCQRCASVVVDGSNYCATHRDYIRARQRMKKEGIEVEQTQVQPPSAP